MARYVDVDKAEYPYMSMSMFGINSKDCKAYNEGVKATEDMIQALPTADVVEVVRCSKCRFNVANMEKDEYDTTDYSGEDIVCSYFMTDGMQSYDFCSYGERRTDNE